MTVSLGLAVDGRIWHLMHSFNVVAPTTAPVQAGTAVPVTPATSFDGACRLTTVHVQPASHGKDLAALDGRSTTIPPVSTTSSTGKNAMSTGNVVTTTTTTSPALLPPLPVDTAAMATAAVPTSADMEEQLPPMGMDSANSQQTASSSSGSAESIADPDPLLMDMPIALSGRAHAATSGPLPPSTKRSPFSILGFGMPLKASAQLATTSATKLPGVTTEVLFSFNSTDSLSATTNLPTDIARVKRRPNAKLLASKVGAASWLTAMDSRVDILAARCKSHVEAGRAWIAQQTTDARAQSWWTRSWSTSLPRQVRTPELGLPCCLANHDGVLVWKDMSVDPRTPLALVETKSKPTCHDVIRRAGDVPSLEVVVGYASGEIVWYDLVAGTYTRFNKASQNGDSVGVSFIRWLPGSDSLIMAAFENGILLILDVDKEDIFADALNFNAGSRSKSSTTTPYVQQIDCSKFRRKANPQASWQVMPPSRDSSQDIWRDTSITHFAFDPTNSDRVALTTASGSCIIVAIDYRTMVPAIIDIHHSYFGAYLCVAWSPDGKYVVCGGQDDCVSVYALRERKMVLRCEGHCNWVTALAFDVFHSGDLDNVDASATSPMQNSTLRRLTAARRRKTFYRLASVGEDGQVCLWDLEFLQSASSMYVMPNATRPSLNRRFRLSMVKANGGNVAEKDACVHQAPSMYDVPVVEPVVNHTIHQMPITDISFTHSSMITACRGGNIRVWRRP